MRNVTVIANNKRKKYRQLFITLLVSTIGFLAIFIMVCVLSANLNFQDVSQVQGTVQEVSEQEDSYAFSINDSEYTLNSVVAGKIDGQQIISLQGQDVSLYILDNKVIGFVSDGYSLSGEEGFQILQDNYNISMITIGVLTAVLLLGTIISLILFLREKKEVRGDVFKLINERQLPIPQVRRQYLKYAVMPILLALVFLIPMAIYSEPIGTMFYVFLGIFTACLLSGIILSAIFMPYIKKREIELFDKALAFEDEKEEYNPYVMDMGNYLPFKLQENGLMYKSEFEADYLIETFKNEEAFKGEDLIQLRGEILKEINQQPHQEGESLLDEGSIIKYDELNLSTKVVFRSANEPIKIFVCSNLDDAQYPTLNNDLYLELDENLYYYIKKYNIAVNGLEKCLKNRKQYMEMYCKGKIKYFDITDEDEIELFTKKSKNNLK